MEILIAMGIFMVIIMAIYASWAAILRSTDAGNRAAAEVQRTRMTVKCVEDAIASTVYFNENSTFYSFEADTTTDFAYLSLVSRLPSNFPGSGLFPDQPMRRVAFEVVQGANGNNELKMMQASVYQVLSDTESPYTITLATNVSHFGLEFWDDSIQDWAYEWLDTNSVPRMVRVSLGFGGKNGTPYGSSAATLQAKTIYLAGTAITKEYQAPDATAGATGRGNGRGNGNNTRNGGNNNMGDPTGPGPNPGPNPRPNPSPNPRPRPK